MDMGFGPIGENAGYIYILAALLYRNMGRMIDSGKLPTPIRVAGGQWRMADS
jgi:hypothetical protein